MSAEIRVAEDPAAEVAELLTEAAVAGGDIVLTGGSSPQHAYELAAERDADWSGATVWFTDERCVEPSHPDSNFGMAERALLMRLSAGPQVVRMEGELGPDAGAGAYEAEVRSRLGAEPRWDLLLLGMGPDGHVASLFPGKPEIEERSRLVVAQRHVLERDVHARADPARLEVDHGGDADADGAHVVGPQRLDRVDELLDQLVAVVDRRLHQRALRELPVAQRRGGDLRPAHVEPDEAVAHSFDAAASSSSTVSEP